MEKREKFFFDELWLERIQIKRIYKSEKKDKICYDIFFENIELILFKEVEILEVFYLEFRYFSKFFQILYYYFELQRLLRFGFERLDVNLSEYWLFIKLKLVFS